MVEKVMRLASHLHMHNNKSHSFGPTLLAFHGPLPAPELECFFIWFHKQAKQKDLFSVSLASTLRI